MSEHEIHVTGWSDDRTSLELRCTAQAGAPCRLITDEWGEGPEPVDECNAIDWWGNLEPDDLIHGDLVGPPPWPVDVTWTDDGPEIRAAKRQP